MSPNKSNNSAPKDTKPFGILIRPVATPANADSINPVSSAFFLFAYNVGPKASASETGIVTSYVFLVVIFAVNSGSPNSYNFPSTDLTA